ncbi:MAG: di-trans,poly-cis-decaprenylcistransferase [Pseudomonadales bacterium]|nr:di-trans,poly-cis-decaprenylcistransferase [Pseudomonadales bacterium]
MSAPRSAAALSQAPLPRHVAIIMDGNNRWLKLQGGSGLDGHKAGAEAARRVIRLCGERGVEVLTLFAFSSENWRRPPGEVKGLLSLFTRFLQRQEVLKLHENAIRLRFIGCRSRFSAQLQSLMREAELLTRDNQAMTVVIAADYGGRWDIVEAARQLARRALAGEIAPDFISEDTFHAHTALHDLPPPDICIRTGGEQRISNFLLWQLAYTELHFSNTLWPDFDASDLDAAFADFARRQRRFGRLSEQLEAEGAG